MLQAEALPSTKALPCLHQLSTIAPDLYTLVAAYMASMLAHAAGVAQLTSCCSICVAAAPLCVPKQACLVQIL